FRSLPPNDARQLPFLIEDSVAFRYLDFLVMGDDGIRRLEEERRYRQIGQLQNPPVVLVVAPHADDLSRPDRRPEAQLIEGNECVLRQGTFLVLTEDRLERRQLPLAASENPAHIGGNVRICTAYVDDTVVEEETDTRP